MTSRLRLALPALLLHAWCTSLLAGQPASGRFSPHCDGASFYLSKADGLSPKQNLILNIRHYALPWFVYRPQEMWEDVHAERCDSEGKCESATHSRIWLDKGNPGDKRVSGKYEVDFGTQHLEGQFLTKYRRDRNWICE